MSAVALCGMKIRLHGFVLIAEYEHIRVDFSLELHLAKVIQNVMEEAVWEKPDAKMISQNMRLIYIVLSNDQ